MPKSRSKYITAVSTAVSTPAPPIDIKSVDVNITAPTKEEPNMEKVKQTLLEKIKIQTKHVDDALARFHHATDVLEQLKGELEWTDSIPETTIAGEESTTSDKT